MAVAPKPRHQELPPNSSELVAAVNSSREMLGWGDNWDGEGSLGYTETVWRQATVFLITNANELWARQHRTIPVPQIEPGPNGSIDLHWQADGKELLINVPDDAGGPATFYGDNASAEFVKGSLNTSADAQWLLMWLTTQ